MWIWVKSVTQIIENMSIIQVGENIPGKKKTTTIRDIILEAMAPTMKRIKEKEERENKKEK